MSAMPIHVGPAYELSLAIQSGPSGHHLSWCSRHPTARRPEPHVKLQMTLSTAELVVLRDAVERAIANAPALATQPVTR